MRRNSSLAPARRKTRPKVPDAVRAEVRARTHGRCHLCLWRAGLLVGSGDLPAATGAPLSVAPKLVHLHHVFPVQKFPELAAEPWNLLGLCVACHFGHEYPGVRETRIPRAALPMATLALATDIGPRLNYLERTYPLSAAGRPPASTKEP